MGAVTGKLVPPLLQQLLRPPLLSHEDAAAAAAAGRAAQLQGLELLLREQPHAVLPQLLEQAAGQQQNGATASLIGAAAAMDPPRLARNVPRLFGALIAGLCQPQALEADCYIAEECMRAAAKLLLRLDAEGLDVLLELLQQQMKAAAPVCDLSAAGRLQLLQQKPAAAKHQSSGAGAASAAAAAAAAAGERTPDDPITADLFLDPELLRQNKAVLACCEAAAANPRKREACCCVLLAVCCCRPAADLEARMQQL
ncbi:hypothetical protein ETH_00040420 [Eimeria tenella]|uniref:Uncharacterized protein n=1 Tax=Eimeria tenella TaxID=5802 RepID=U6KVB5_EIMTE|nr:hypothetical protein ETH_00040420 [Eimeria tenella]CDJ39420.1 hypothetical protein ETH_00040420 [Eimeria tenella]|eukprot:XP_013230175.1 hypothetical protein ETH_00040420 [Eimeria tenella]